MTGSEKVSPRKLIESFKYAIEGIGYCLNTQRNMRIHLVIAAVVIAGCIFLQISSLEFITVIISVSMVFICELINTAVERAVDTATKEYDPIAKIAKDVAAGAVLIAAISSVIVGFLVFGKYF